MDGLFVSPVILGREVSGEVVGPADGMLVGELDVGRTVGEDVGPLVGSIDG